jgi:hypothetical protein
MSNLDGRWSNGSFKLVIKGDKYSSFFGGSRYGKGKITFDDETFSLTSTHASYFFFLWFPFVEKVNGKYVITGDDEATVSNIEGRYDFLNGKWVKEGK